MEQQTKLKEQKNSILWTFVFIQIFSIPKYFCTYTITSSEQKYDNMLYLMDIQAYQIRIHGMLIVNISLKKIP